MSEQKLDLKILKKLLSKDNLKGNHTYFGRREVIDYTYYEKGELFEEAPGGIYLTVLNQGIEVQDFITVEEYWTLHRKELKKTRNTKINEILKINNP